MVSELLHKWLVSQEGGMFNKQGSLTFVFGVNQAFDVLIGSGTCTRGNMAQMTRRPV